jgi:hypothetical protein
MPQENHGYTNTIAERVNGILKDAVGLLFSCKKNEDIPQSELSMLSQLVGQNGMSYSESIVNWNELKIIKGNSYIYQTLFSSWIGEANITEVTVIDGIVTSRIYEHFQTNETNGQRKIMDSYSETIDNLGVHENGARPITIDELYNNCSSEYLTVDANNNTIYFETELNGLMTLCGFVPNGCLDDCYIGVSINYFDWI